jgi:adenine-specific DNA-methyltransferase
MHLLSQRSRERTLNLFTVMKKCWIQKITLEEKSDNDDAPLLNSGNPITILEFQPPND